MDAMDAMVDMHYRIDAVENVVSLETDDVFYAGVYCEHVAHPRVASRIFCGGEGRQHVRWNAVLFENEHSFKTYIR